MESMVENIPMTMKELNNTVLTNEIKSYSSTSEIIKLITRLKFESDDAINQFSEVLVMMVDELARVTGDNMLQMFKNNMIDFIKQNPKKVIDNLIISCYKKDDGMVRNKILLGDDSYFMNNKLENLSNGDGDVINYIFQFKNFWGNLNQDNKIIIKSTLIALITLCDIRYTNFKKYTCLRSLNSKHIKIFSGTSSGEPTEDSYDAIF